MEHAVVHAEFKAMLGVLRARMKTKGVKYSSIAKELRTSESTIKRIFAGRECNVSWIFELCRCLNIDFRDLVFTALSDDWHFTVLSDEQEELFVDKPDLLRLFSSLYHGLSPGDAKRKFSLTEASFHKALRNLERVGLLSFESSGKIAFNLHGQIHWQENGPLVKQFFDKIGRETFEHFLASRKNADVVFFLGGGLMSKQTAEQYNEELRDLIKRFARSMARDERMIPREELKSQFLLAALGPFSPTTETTLPHP
jgi:hypothetical protein